MNRLIALDMDGTLLTDKKEITPRTLSALSRAMDGGACVSLISGRPLFGMRWAADALSLSTRGGYLSACNGALIVDAKSGECLCRRFVEREPANVILSEAEALGLVTLGYDETDGSIMASDVDNEFARYEARWNFAPIRATRLSADAVSSALYLVCGAPERLTPFFDRALELAKGRIRLLRGAPDFFYISAPNADKGDAAAFLLDALHLQKDALIAFGDSMNDLGLIKCAGMGIAMGNACEELKSAARCVAKDNEHDGVAQALEQLLL